MKRTILALVSVLLLALPLSNAVPNQIYFVSLEYDNGTLALRDIVQKDGFPTGRNIQPDVGYECRIYSFQDRLLESFLFDMPLTSCYDRFDKETGEISGGCIRADSANFSLAIQHFNNAKEMDFYDPGGDLILNISLANFSDSGAKPIEGGEDGVEDEPEYSSKNHDKYSLVFVLLSLVLLFIYLLRRRRK